MKKLYERYSHALPIVIYMIIYMAWFHHIETSNLGRMTVIHTALDDRIPFCEYFVIPYFLWFGYVAAVVIYLIFTDTDKRNYYNCITFLITGMTVFLVVSTLWPNVQHLRPYVLPRDNACSRLVSYLYSIDTPTNLWPSIHVYNSIGAYVAVAHDKRLGSIKWVKVSAFLLSAAIIMSTMFIKQHSTFDVMTAFIMAAVVYVIVYRMDVVLAIREGNRVRRHRSTSNGINK